MPPTLPPKPPPCHVIAIEGELNAGKPFSHVIGNGLRLWFEPIAAGWILRVVPTAGPLPAHDYAELATPPYQSVNPLSLSTDFSFRAQDAVGWNPRRFHYATSPAAYDALNEVYTRFMQAGATPPPPLELELSDQIAKAGEGKLTILDASLVPGAADQWKMAAAVSERFTQTAHILLPPPGGKPMPLGHLESIRFRVEFLLPDHFKADPTNVVVPHVCGSL